MAAITYDGQSFMVDGRRIWLVGGTIEYARVPREDWAERIAQAKRAGLNCITTSVVWSRHEPRAGQFDFSGHQDLRYFVELIKTARMYCVLRIGPFVGNGFDLGGLPPWLLANPAVQLRTANGQFLEACSRYISAVAKQVRDLQATMPQPEADQVGPIVLIQNESQWTCGHDGLASGYLGELDRYLRESGFEVPFANANDLWQGVEGEIDCWSGQGSMLANLRQLAVVRPSQPRLVSAFKVGEAACWGGEARRPVDPTALQQGLCEVLAAGAQFNVEPVAGGTNFGFGAGRLPTGPAAFGMTSDDRGAPIGEGGQLRPAYHALRRVGMFASRFGRLFSHLDPKRHSVSLMPGPALASAGKTKGKNGHEAPGGHVVVHATGSQGSVVFVFAPARKAGEPASDEPVNLLLPDGGVLPIYLGEQAVAWVVLDHRLVGRSQLDYSNLSVFALAGRVLVCSGPAGTPARLSINGADLQAQVPTDADEPLLLDHEGVLVMIVPDEALPRLHVGDDAVYMDVLGLTLQGEPMVTAWGNKFRKISGEAGLERIVAEQHPKRPVVKVEVKHTPPPPKGKPVKPAKKGKKPEPPPPPPAPPAPLPPTAVVVAKSKGPGRLALSHWSSASLADYLDGSGPRFASINGPADLNQMGAPYGYGWYRVTLRNGAARRARLALPHAADRVTIFCDGQPVGLVGVGPGAELDASVPLAKGEQTLVLLAENLGRFSGGSQLGEAKGVVGHFWEVQAAKQLKGTPERGAPVDVLSFRAPLWNLHPGDATDPWRTTWTLPHKGKHPIILRFDPHGHRGLLLLNDKPIRFFDASGPATIFLEEAALGRGNNVIQAAVLGSGEAASKDLAGALTVQECAENLSAKADWAFAKWERPSAESFGNDHHRAAHTPRWHRATFSVEAAANLLLDTAGLSKGQAYVNGHHLGRYFTSTAAGKAVGPQTKLHVPASFLLPGHENEVMLFDEHGHSPSKVRLSDAGHD
jgi:hypothetical protein